MSGSRRVQCLILEKEQRKADTRILYAVPDGPPTNITVYCISTTELVVRWESPLVEHMYGELRGYRLTYRPADNSTSGNFTDVEASTRQITLSGLQTYTRYVISVAAFNQMGLGVQSEDIIGVTGEDGKCTNCL